ncbi:MAG: hypothetical protein AMJ95_07510 [Omnitrophica WOR_2 bacterium SM23_72]|nr:MAG: hypothetical protein AMJ95_07510 [Omnitrophica WOR_2 bacterium SM23_72]
MIVPMKKVFLVMQSKDASSALGDLRAQGLVHVEHQQVPEGKDLQAIQEDLSLIHSAINILSRQEKERPMEEKQDQPLSNWKLTARHIIDVDKRLDQLKEFGRALKNRIISWEPWGDFEPESIRTLSAKGIFVRLYQIPVREIKNLPRNLIVKKIYLASGMANCVVISRQRQDIPYKEITLPKMGLEAMQRRLEEDFRVQGALEKEIKKHVSYLRELIVIKNSLEKELEFYQALKGMGQAATLSYLAGYVPFDAVPRLLEKALTQRWAIKIEKPREEDYVPTLIRNPKWVSIIRPVFKLIEIIPGYREVDISLWFLIFFSVFFGIIIGDAAYGLIFLLLTLWVQIKWGRKVADKSLFFLLYLLSFSAVTWGVLSGTFFGQEWLPQTVKPLLPALRNVTYVQNLCFVIGTVHLSLAHLWRFIRKFPSVSFIAEAGWIAILWGAFFLARMLILGQVFPEYGKWLFVAGAASVIIFSKPKKNLLKGIASGLGNFLLNAINNFTDIVSYIRLFAVGLATVAIADAFNRMAMSIGFNSILSSMASACILLLGHLLNIVLGPVSIIVHGVRLNVLEFCSHLDVKWSGIAYRPLKT